MANTYLTVFNIANNEVGYMEKKSMSQLDSKTANAGYNNYTKYWAEMKPSFQGEPWCLCFVDWCFKQAYGEAEAKKLLCYPSTNTEWTYYTPTGAQYFKDKKQWYTVPKKGDVVFFKNSTRICHVGLVYKVDGSYIYTQEANSSNALGLVPNGGEVVRKQYALGSSYIAGYGRPKYDEEESYALSPIITGIDGLTITDELNVREYPSVNAPIIGTYKAGDQVSPTHKCFVGNAPWFKTREGYISGKYVVGWIFEETVRKWWYVMRGYQYLTNQWLRIGKTWYYCDAAGYIVTNDWVEVGGKWYFFDVTGAMQTGWIRWNNKDYYLSKTTGEMAVDAYVKSSVRDWYYYCNAEGVWENTEKDCHYPGGTIIF